MTLRPHEIRNGPVQRAAKALIRSAHVRVFNRGLPKKVGIYFHSLPEDHYYSFRAMVAHFRQSGYRIGTDPDDFLKEASDPVVFISFDDCFQHWYEARPLFDELAVRATFYTNTCAFRDRADEESIERYLSQVLGVDPTLKTISTDELKALRSDGHTIGGHTHSHLVLTAVSHGAAIADIRKNKECLEDLLGEEIYHFAYPYGMRRYFNDSLQAACLEMGYRTVARAIPGLLHTTQGPVQLHRTGWDSEASISQNVAMIGVDGSGFENLTGRSAVG